MGARLKRTKYGNRKVTKNGETWDSVREYERHLILLDMQKRGEIRDLKRQPKFLLRVNETLICTYIPDWRYYDEKANKWVAEDAKGYSKIPVWVLKWKLAKALFPEICWKLS